VRQPLSPASVRKERVRSEPTYGTPLADEKLAAEAKEMEEKAEQAMNAANEFLDEWVVDKRSFEGYPEATLTCARGLMIFLMVFITTSTLGLCIGFVFAGSLEGTIALEQVAEFDSPSVVICPSPWGTSFTKFQLTDVSFGEIPGTAFHPIEHQVVPFALEKPAKNEDEAYSGKKKKGNSTNLRAVQGSLKHCHKVLIDQQFHPHGDPGEYIAFDTVRLSFSATSADGFYNFAFTNPDGPNPQSWSWAYLGTRTSGELVYDQVEEGASEVSEGTPHARLPFRVLGSGATGGDTQLEFCFGIFLINLISAQSSPISIFAIVSFILLVAAALNNFGLFELFFVERQDEDAPPPLLEPNILCRKIFGPVFVCCRRKEQESARREKMSARAAEASDSPAAGVPKATPPASVRKRESPAEANV